jgi:hypothetical protein
MSLSPINKRVQQMQKVQAEGLELFKKKNADYGDSFANYGPVGVIVRLGDKINRLSSVTQNRVNLVDTESTRDTLIDLHNYAAMAIMLLDEKKKILHRRIDEIKHAPINQIVNPLASRIRQPTFSERRRNSWATGYLKKEDKMGEWARLSRSSESRK